MQFHNVPCRSEKLTSLVASHDNSGHKIRIRTQNTIYNNTTRKHTIAKRAALESRPLVRILFIFIHECHVVVCRINHQYCGSICAASKRSVLVVESTAHTTR